MPESKEQQSRTGGPSVDPTQNVQDLSEASNRRQDDLRELNNRRVEAHIARVDSEIQCLKEANAARDVYVKEVGDLRAEHAKEMQIAEAKRIDAIRAVDVNAVAVASQRASDQASVLAAQVQQSAEALRTLVASTAATVAQSQLQLASTLSARLTTVEQAQYEGKGKQAFADPMMEKLVARMESLLEARATGTGKSEGIDKSWAVIVAVIAIALSLYAALKPASPTAATSPQVIYAPAPVVAQPGITR